ncbi:MAG: hypothetical protein ABJC07_04450 [Acidobacteriota bacterium]
MKGRRDVRPTRPREVTIMLKNGETVFAFRSEGVIRLLRKLDAATELARALERCLPSISRLGDDASAEEQALRALAIWEDASR